VGSGQRGRWSRGRREEGVSRWEGSGGEDGGRDEWVSKWEGSGGEDGGRDEWRGTWSRGDGRGRRIRWGLGGEG